MDMPDPVGTPGIAGQAAQFGSDVLAELQEAVRASEVPSAAPLPAVPESAAQEAPAVEPPPAAERPVVTPEMAMRIRDIVEKAKTDIARILADYEAKRADISGNLREQKEEERKRRAEELVAQLKSQTS